MTAAGGVWRQLEASPRAIPEAHKAEILHAVTRERLSLRAAERTFRVARQTIAGWIKKKAAELPALKTTLLPGENGDVLELDEVWSFVQANTGAPATALRVGLASTTRQYVQLVATVAAGGPNLTASTFEFHPVFWTL